jgi:uncharacterized membrane protein YadS
MQDREIEPGRLVEETRKRRGGLVSSEDWCAVWVGGAILVASFLFVYDARPSDFPSRVREIERQESEIQRLRAVLAGIGDSGVRAAGGGKSRVVPPGDAKSDKQQLSDAQTRLKRLRSEAAPNPAAKWLAKLGSWDANPLDAFSKRSGDATKSLLPGLFAVFVASLVLFGLGLRAMGRPFIEFAKGFWFVFALAVFGMVLSNQVVVKNSSLEYPLWALLAGLLVSNTVGTPAFVKPAVQTEFYVKTGLVLLGATVLLSRLLALGVPGVFVSWVVTPLVVVATYAFGQKILRIRSRTLNIVISADLSVCGVSAAIATAAACRAKKEELSLAIGLSLAFTVVMMVVMPMFIRAVGMSDVLGGAWLGGTIDATGAVAAAGAALGETAMAVAVTVKMIQNILIGVVAFCVAVYWVAYVEPSATDIKPNAWEIWRRFPKFVVGFLAASIGFSYLSGTLDGGQILVDSMIDGSTDVFRGWFFCLAFVSIGLETNFRELAKYMEAGKPLVLYVCGQILNLCLTLLMAWLMFEVVFRESVAELLK